MRCESLLVVIITATLFGNVTCCSVVPIYHLLSTLGGSIKTLTNSWYMATHFTSCCSHVLCEIFLRVAVYTWLLTKENKWIIKQYGGKWMGNLRNVCWVKMLSMAVTKYDVLPKKTGRDRSTDFWRQWVTRPCILLLVNSVWSILYWVQYCIRHALCSDYTQFWLHMPCQEPNNYIKHNSNVLALAHGSLVWCNRAQTFICMVQLNGLHSCFVFRCCIWIVNWRVGSLSFSLFYSVSPIKCWNDIV